MSRVGASLQSLKLVFRVPTDGVHLLGIFSPLQWQGLNRTMELFVPRFGPIAVEHGVGFSGGCYVGGNGVAEGQEVGGV